MTLTEEQLDAYCGEHPQHSVRCLKCKWTSAEYHNPKEARGALADHMRWRHPSTDSTSAAMTAPTKR